MRSPRSRVSSATIFFALLSLALGIALYLKTRPSAEPAPAARAPASPRPHAPGSPRLRASPNSSAFSAAPRREAPRVAIVIDDLGNDPAAVRRIARWPHLVAGAVLPDLPGSAQAARELEQSGKEVLLHLPMEPEGYPEVRPGPGVVLRSQSEEEIGRTLETDLASVPGAVGVNNHMGSAATADERVMRAVAQVLARRGLFFVDSRTTDATVARDAALRARVPSASRRVFLDDIASEAAIQRSLADLVVKAREEGSAIGIGHPYAVTLAVLERELPQLNSSGVKLVRVSELVR